MGLIDFIEIASEAVEYFSDSSSKAKTKAGIKKLKTALQGEENRTNHLEQENTKIDEKKITNKTINLHDDLYDNQLEQLISHAFVDGELSEKEKQVLFKKAQAQGIDLDEFEMVLDARLVQLKKEEKEKVKKEEKEKAEKSAPKSNKYGDVRKCPACGAIVPALTGVCTECGFEFSGVEANFSSQKLAEDLIAIQSQYNDKINRCSDEHKKWELNKQKIYTIAQTIKSFPIPITKADLFEFLTTMQTNMLSLTIYRVEGAAYFAKYNEAILKVNVLFKNDSQFSSFIANNDIVVAEYNKIHKKQKGFGFRPINKIWRMIALYFLIMFFIFIPFMFGRSQEIPSSCLKKVERAIDRGNFKKAKNLIVDFTGGHDDWDGDDYLPADCYESVIALERALLKEDRYEEAEEIYFIYLDKIKGIPNEHLYINRVAGPLERYKNK